jgi:drug/metabolite transporter superfamily protein YnfA
MGLDAVWQQCVYGGYQVWAWLRHEASVYPFMFLAAVIVIISALILYKTEVRRK